MPETKVPDPKKHQIDPEHAEKIKDWLATRGGLALWQSVDLSDPGASWTGPLNDKDGKPVEKPHWKSDSKPYRVITDINEVEVVVPKVVKELKLGIKRGSGFMQLVYTDKGSERIKREVKKAGAGAWHQPIFPAFEGTPNCVILAPDKVVPLAEFDPAKHLPKQLGGEAAQPEAKTE